MAGHCVSGLSLQSFYEEFYHIRFQGFGGGAFSGPLPGVDTADRGKDHQHGSIGIDGFHLTFGGAVFDDIGQPFAVAAPLVEKVGKIGFRQVAPFVVGDIDVFILVQHHADMQADDRLHLFEGTLVAGFNYFEVGHEFVGYLETDGLEDLRFGLDMVVQAGSFYSNVFGKIPHRGGPEAFFPEEPGGLFDDHLFLGAVSFALNFRHSIQGRLGPNAQI